MINLPELATKVDDFNANKYASYMTTHIEETTMTQERKPHGLLEWLQHRVNGMIFTKEVVVSEKVITTVNPLDDDKEASLLYDLQIAHNGTGTLLFLAQQHMGNTYLWQRINEVYDEA